MLLLTYCIKYYNLKDSTSDEFTTMSNNRDTALENLQDYLRDKGVDDNKILVYSVKVIY